MKKNVIGIDLGTTNSEVAVIENGRPKLLSIDGSPIVPSVICFDQNGQVLVGQPALNYRLMAPESSISLIKRKMGRAELVEINGKDYTPPMLSSLILARLKLAAEEYYEGPVTQAVITVPAFFDEKQREATKEAATLAGLEVLRLLNEPTSAALSYALGQKREETCLVYDLGGGTFDVSVVDLSRDVMEVRASHGDTELGGSDFDKLIYEKIRQDFLEKHNIDISTSPLSKLRIMQAAEVAKIRLSTQHAAEIHEEFIVHSNGIGLHLSFKITRIEFENMIRPVIERTLNAVHTALTQASCLPSAIDRLILVGGSTQIPLVSQILEKDLGISAQLLVNPATVVAQGAAIESANLSGEKVGSLMVDITSHSLGTGVCDADFSTTNAILIRRNTPLPAVASQIFYKMSEKTEGIKVTAYQGESSNVEYCRFLGDFELNGLSSTASREILIRFELDRNCLLNVTATEVGSGKSNSQIMKRLDKSEIQTKNIADLSSIRINVDEPENRSDSLANHWISGFDDLLPDDEEEKELEDELTISDDDQHVVSLESVELEDQVKLLLARKDVSEGDKQDLERELVAVKAGDAEAKSRLADLIYYIE